MTKDIKSQQGKENSEALYVKLKNKEDELENLKLDNIKLKETIDALQENLKKASHKLDTLKKQNQDTGNNINILSGFIENLQQLEAREKEIASE